jgi:hypothetical protein
MLWWLFLLMIVIVTVAPLLAIWIADKTKPRFMGELILICYWLSDFTVPVGAIMFVGWIVFGIILLVGAM